jgi:hypothetical protein
MIQTARTLPGRSTHDDRRCRSHHSVYAMWLGSPVPLKLDTLRRNHRPELIPSA